MDLKPRQQIIYVPFHADGDLNHPDCQAGFVTSVDAPASMAWCRYWNKSASGMQVENIGKSTRFEYLVQADTVPQELVDRLYDELYGDGQ